MKRILKAVKEDSIKTDHHNIDNREFSDKKLLKDDKLPSKEYGEKTSILVELYENKHIATVYHLCLAILFSLFLNGLVYNYLYNGEIKLGLNLLIKGYTKLHLSIAIWLGMFVASFLCYYGLKVWALVRIQLPQNSVKTKLWDKFMIGLLITYYSLFLYFPPLLIARYEIPLAASMTLLSDCVRMLMVFHSFVRTIAPRVVRYKKDDASIIVPSLSNFMYFYFAPTVVYKDDYPRSKERNWKIIFGYLVEFFGVVLLLSFLVEICFLDKFENYGLRPYSGKEIVMIFLNNSMFGLLFCFSFFYILLHIWMNLFAELMMFSDRTFYKDWWTSIKYERYYRTWNVVVHDWLYTYIYKDFYENVYSKSKVPAKLLVFIISTVFHEYVLGFAFKFCLPILSLQFILVGVPIMTWQVKPNYIGNTLLLYALGLGTGIIVGVYTMEYYSRVNCPIEDFTFYDYFIPHLFSCNK